MTIAGRGDDVHILWITCHPFMEMWNSVTERGKVQDCQGGGREVAEGKANEERV